MTVILKLTQTSGLLESLAFKSHFGNSVLHRRKMKKMGRRLQEARFEQQRLSDLLEQDIVGVAQFDAQGRCRLVNDRYCAIMGWGHGSLQGRLIADVSPQENRDRLNQLHRRVLQDGRHFIDELCLLRPGAAPCWLQLTVTVQRNAAGHVCRYLVQALDASARKQQEKAWHQAAEILAVAERAAGAGAWRWNHARNEGQWSAEMFRLFGLDPQRHSVSIESWLSAVHPADRDATIANLDDILKQRDSFVDSYRVLRPDGQVIWIDCHGQVTRDAQGNAIEMAGVCIDATAQKLAELQIMQLNAELETKVRVRTAELLKLNDELRQLARHDVLTGLPNRLAANERIELEFVALRRDGQPCAMLLIDIDHFKRVNDGFGHAVGDRVLRWVGRTLLQSLRESDFVARWGGEEFLVLLPATGLEDALLVGEKLRRAVECCTDPDVGTTTISLGLALVTACMSDTDTPLREADACLYAAKRGGRNQLVAAANGQPPV